jgi:Skp family chaperone for outer membrane proteins
VNELPKYYPEKYKEYRKEANKRYREKKKMVIQNIKKEEK